MSDMIKTIGRSIIQHGPTNDRVYLMKLHADDATDFAEYLDRLACSRGYSKVFAKVPRWSVARFVAAGYEVEASIPDFFPDGVAACFMGKYFTDARKLEPQPQLVQEVLAVARAQEPSYRVKELPGDFTMRMAREEDTVRMAEVYREVFATYPFPIHEPGFLQAAMHGGTVFFGIWKGERIVALASAEIDSSSRSAEMTDFATLPEYRGHGFALHLLQQVQKIAQSRGVRLFFTIARAYSFGMNVTFARSGYRYGGTLTNNTNISGNLESMNVWYKTVPDQVAP
ncbi:putative beta-lysine N-acetyltransferase [Geobacter sp. AOG2]|uniref:putative beta-lysine N-acetyltransferase n=1 Tax=Geobacter sp. AOG2 TaxID=1566347 RepID=UPI001CC3BFE3|nr:putative beta-lysine N-acetyltransferase [Geobacter sp. AOG2]GFE60701.1 putative beta-lysine N-acetyltransferase [Geobacter sp. AOG2]